MITEHSANIVELKVPTNEQGKRTEYFRERPQRASHALFLKHSSNHPLISDVRVGPRLSTDMHILLAEVRVPLFVYDRRHSGAARFKLQPDLHRTEIAQARLLV